MAEAVKFTSTKLSLSGKKGITKPDSEGFYEIIIGGLNTYNSANEYYTLEGAKLLFEQSSTFMRRVQNGCLKGEVGHPKRPPGMTMEEYVNRVLAVEETNVCAHFKEIWLDPAYGRKLSNSQTPDLVAIVGRVKPAGAKGFALEKAFESPGENVCFSIRALTKDYFNRGQCYRVLTNIITWDWVTEPGIRIANKFDTPTMESLDEQIITRKAIQNVANATLNAPGGIIATESNRVMASDCLNALDRVSNDIKAHAYKDW